LGPVLAIVGAALVVGAVADIVVTTLTVERRAGPLTRAVSTLMWRALKRMRTVSPFPGFLGAAGLLVTITVVGLWITMIVTGWFLLFASSLGAVVGTSSGVPADGWSRLYFAAYSIFTLGNGELRPEGHLWQVLTWMAAGSGLFLITLTITYLMPLMSAVTHKRSLARMLAGLGRTPGQIVATAWRGDDFDRIEQHLLSLTPSLALLAEQHLAYPVLHFFHSPERETALAPGLAALDEALLLLTEAVDPAVQPPRLATEPAQHAIKGFLDTLPQAYVRPSDEAPPAPDLSLLARQGIPHRPLEDVLAAVRRRDEHRRRMRSLVQDEGWEWEALR
jgi:hypothetical protein